MAPSIIKIFSTATMCLILSACTVGPNYVKPEMKTPVAYKETGEWKVAEPRDHLNRGAWWEVFNDPQLSALEEQVDISNQNLVAAEAQYRQALALVKVARAGYFPVLNAGASASRSQTPGSTGSSGAGGTRSGSSSNVSSDFNFSGSASWDLDLWGKVRRSVEAGKASAQASAADLEGVRLAAQVQVAQAYFQLRALDAQKKLLDETAEGYRNFLQITKNRYETGVAARSDVLQAETQYKTTQTQSIDTGVQRAQLEHAIALLIGKSPVELTIPYAPLNALPPAAPASIPSELLERRPDIASAERQAAAANARIGVAEAAYYPTISLSASGGFEASNIAKWFTWPSSFWTLGPALLQQTILDGGLRRAQAEQARAAYDQTVAAYRQTVLTGFQQVEDNLAALRILEQEAGAQEEAVKAALQSLDVTINRYKSGVASALDVIITQTIALNNQLSAVSIMGRRMTASVLLIDALGGGWKAGDLPQIQ
ncbi:MAG: efflux transporter outer membrane subunit [Syntrophobacter sp.]